jgi:GH35 family endo-1,4-beta-xylanase
LWSAVRAVGVLLVLILEFSERKMSRFLDDVHFVDALNELVDDSGSEGDVSETDCRPSDSGMLTHCIGMNFQTFILIVARSHN